MHFFGDTGPPLSFRCPDQYSSVNITRLEAPFFAETRDGRQCSAYICRPLQALVKRQRLQ